MKTTDIEYSIILPCLNEEKTLGICIRKIHQFFSNTGLTYEIIVADNGSTDNSALVAKNNRADVIQVSQKGYGSAFETWHRTLQWKYIIMGDADDSYNFLELSLFIERLQAGYDMVMGNRFAGGITKGLCHGFIAMSAIRSCRPWGVFYLRIILETSIVV